MYEERNQYQITRKDARGCFVESLSDAFPIGKAHFAFATYDISRPAGQRQTNNIHIYIDLDEILELCRKLECGELRYLLQTKKKNNDKTPLYQCLGGTSAEKCLKTVKMASTKYYDNLPTTGNEHGRAFRDLELEKELHEEACKLGLGAQFPVALSYLSEIVCGAERPKYMTLYQLMTPIGFAVAGVMTVLILPHFDWRGVYLAEALPALFVIGIIKTMPESPLWLEAKGRYDEADAICTKFEEEAIAHHGSLPEVVAIPRVEEKAAFKDLFSKKYLRDAKEITIGRRNEGTSNVKHVVFTVHAKDKYAALKRIVDYYPQIYGIIFCRTRKETQEIADKLMQEGYNADSLHGELSQAQRDAVMQKFRIRNLQLLVATDVAARGLDVDDLTHVINYGLPDDTESYTHRSGRTGRAGKTGTSIAIINLREKGKMREIERIIGKKFIQGEMPTGKQICEKQLLKVIDELEKVKVNEDEIRDFMPDIYRKLDWLSKEDLIKRMVSLEFNRFLDYYRDREEIEIATGSERSAKSGERGSNARKATPGFKRLFINLGKMDNFFPNELISLLNNNTRGRVELGRIDLMQKFSFFEVEEKEATNVVKALNRASWNGRKVSVEVAGDEGKEAPRGKRPGTAGSYGKKEFDSKKRSYKEDGKRNDATGKRSEKAESPANDKKKGKPSREERGYTKARGKKDDWKQFFQNDNRPLRGQEPDFAEEGWAKRSKRKK